MYVLMYPPAERHTHSIFTALKILCALPVHPSLPNSLETHDLFTDSIVLSLPVS